MKFKLFAIALLASVSLVACNEADTTNEGSTPKEKSVSSENESVNIKEMVYNFSNRIVTDKSAVILQDQLIVEDGGKDTVYDLSNEDFFVSISPYIDQTHP
jgi:ABC-type oligopeptide transport system substrate-binding subunit